MLRRRNGMCPVCYLRTFIRPEKDRTPTLYANEPY